MSGPYTEVLLIRSRLAVNVFPEESDFTDVTLYPYPTNFCATKQSSREKIEKKKMKDGRR